MTIMFTGLDSPRRSSVGFCDFDDHQVHRTWQPPLPLSLVAFGDFDDHHVQRTWQPRLCSVGFCDFDDHHVHRTWQPRLSSVGFCDSDDHQVHRTWQPPSPSLVAFGDTIKFTGLDNPLSLPLLWHLVTLMTITFTGLDSPDSLSSVGFCDFDDHQVHRTWQPPLPLSLVAFCDFGDHHVHRTWQPQTSLFSCLKNNRKTKVYAACPHRIKELNVSITGGNGTVNCCFSCRLIAL